jgi:Domain of unknown function (DUF4112)
MQINLAIDFIIRFIPFINDFADAIYKCNTKNAALLENKLRKRGERRLKNANRQYKVDLNLSKIYDNAFNNNFTHYKPPPRYTFRKKPRRPKRIYNSPNTRNEGWLDGRRKANLKSLVIPRAQPPRIKQSILKHCQYITANGRRPIKIYSRYTY